MIEMDKWDILVDLLFYTIQCENDTSWKSHTKYHIGKVGNMAYNSASDKMIRGASLLENNSRKIDMGNVLKVEIK